MVANRQENQTEPGFLFTIKYSSSHVQKLLSTHQPHFFDLTLNSDDADENRH